jgi:hypothetical protein
VQPRCELAAARQDEALQLGQLGVEAVAISFERVDLRLRDAQSIGDPERHREVGAEVEELVLHAREDLEHLRGRICGHGQTDV